MNPSTPGGSGDTGKSSSRQPGGHSLGPTRSTNTARGKKKSAIPKLAKRSSVIYSGGVLGPPNGKTVHTVTNGHQGRGSTSLGSFRVPWVPAPGKSSAVFPPNSELPQMQPGSRQNAEECSSSNNSAFLSSSSSCSQNSASKSPPPMSRRRSQVQVKPSTNSVRDGINGTKGKSSEGDTNNERKSSGPSEESDTKGNNFSALKSKDSLIQIVRSIKSN